MKYKLLFILLFLGISQSIWALSASINHAIYKEINSGKTYIEIYTYVVGQSVVFSKIENSAHYQSKLQSTIIISQGDKIISYKKYNLNSPLTKIKIDFSDVTRMYLSSGAYEIEVQIIDLNEFTNDFSVKKEIIVDSNQSLSTVRLLSSATSSTKNIPTVKNGIDMQALAYDRYFPNQNVLIAYLELYPDLSQAFSYIKYTIKNQETVITERIKRYENKAIVPCLLSMDISNLSSDEYLFQIEVITKSQDVLYHNEMRFSKSNPEVDMKLELKNDGSFQTSFVQSMSPIELDYNLKAIIPIATSLERRMLSNSLNSEELQVKKYALYEYWFRNAGANNPESLFQNYMEVAKAVDKKYYSGFGYGFESDRGHIFLKYGKPSNSIVVTNEPSAPPYEIWVYDYIEDTHEHNVRFIFYTPSLSDDYLLLHSTCKNELSNNRWEHELYKKAPKDLLGNSIDGGDVKENWNRKAKYYFDNL